MISVKPIVLLFEVSKFLLQFVDLGSSSVYGVLGLNITVLDVAKPLSCLADYGLEPTVCFPLQYSFQDLAQSQTVTTLTGC